MFKSHDNIKYDQVEFDHLCCKTLSIRYVTYKITACRSIDEQKVLKMLRLHTNQSTIKNALIDLKSFSANIISMYCEIQTSIIKYFKFLMKQTIDYFNRHKVIFHVYVTVLSSYHGK